jgi:hypothetical protein
LLLFYRLCVGYRPRFWRNLLWNGSGAGGKGGDPPHCLAAAAALERVDVSAAARELRPEDSFPLTCDFPPLASLPEALEKPALVIRRHELMWGAHEGKNHRAKH